MENPNPVPEVVLYTFDGLYVWLKPKPGMSLIGSFIGRVVLTSRRFLFLSTGTSGIAKALLVGAAGGALLSLTLGRTRTDELDLSDLANEGSLAIGLERITASRCARRWDFSHYFTLETAGGGLPPVCSFMTRFGRSRDQLDALRSTLDDARGKLIVNPYRA